MKKTGYTAIVAHDAGAANHIFAWLKSGLLDEKDCKICLSGPALTTYQKIKPLFKSESIENALSDAKQLISGTGWSSTLEHNARVVAEKRNIYSIAVIDHWVNYSERFIKNKILQLPDEIWVVDEYAENIAKETFPTIPIKQKNNDFIENHVNEVKNYKKEKMICNTNLLFLMEPIRKKWSKSNKLGELQALEYAIENKHLFYNQKNKLNIIIKPHPSDPKNKYTSWLSEHKNLEVKINETDSLAQLISWSDIVAGCETYAMIVALHCGKKVISALPPTAPPCALPHKGIIRLSELN